MQRLYYGTCWISLFEKCYLISHKKKERTIALVVSAVLAGFRTTRRVVSGVWQDLLSSVPMGDSIVKNEHPAAFDFDIF